MVFCHRYTHVSPIFLSVFLTILKCYNEAYQLVLIPEVKTIHRRVGEKLLVKCAIKDPNTGNLSPFTPNRWMSPKNEVITSGAHARVYAELRQGELSLRNSNVTLSDHGLWQCIADSPASKVSFQLIVEDVIKIRANRVEYALLNRKFRLKCQLAVSSDVTVRWKKGEQKTLISNRDPDYEITADGLHIKQVKISDNDTFWCSAYNFEAGVKREQPIQLIVAQEITLPHISCARNPCGVEGQKATLTCHAKAIPPVQFQWSKGPTLNIRPTAELKYHIEDDTLTIYNLSKSDSGFYQCRAYNDREIIGRTAMYDLDVLVPPKILPIKTVTASAEGSSLAQAELICEIDPSGAADVTFQWLDQDKVPIHPYNFNERNIKIIESRIPLRSRLIFPRPTPKEFGTYTCEALNLAGKATAFGSLLVRSFPRFNPASPTFFYATNGRETDISCAFTGFPLPTVTWRDELGTKLKEGSYRNFEVLKIRDRSDSPGNIKSVMTVKINAFETKMGNSEVTFSCDILSADNRQLITVKEARLPSVVNFTHDPSISIDRIKFKVRLPMDTGGMPFKDLMVRYKEVKTHDESLRNPLNHIIIPLNGTQSESIVEVSIKNLKAKTLYRLGVSVRTEAGESPIKENMFITLSKTVPLVEIYLQSKEVKFGSSTNNISLLNSGDAIVVETTERLNGSTQNNRLYQCKSHNSCVISWQIVSSGGDVISSAILEYVKTDPRGIALSDVKTLSSSTSSIAQNTIKNLDPMSLYDVTVIIQNKAGFQFRRTFRVGTSRAPPGYMYELSSRNSKTSVWKILLYMFAIATAAILVCLGIPLIRVNRLASNSNGLKKDRFRSRGLNSGSRNERFLSTIAPTLSADSTLIEPGECLDSGDGILHDANVNPLYNEADAVSGSPWNVFPPSSYRHTLTTIKDRSANDFSRV